MRRTLSWLVRGVALLGLVAFSVGCASENGGGMAEQAPATEEAAPSLGIRPNGDTEIQPDLTQVSDELKQVYDYIDEHIDEHVLNFQRWVQQPSISNTGEGIPESAQMVKGFFDQLGCQESQVYEVGETEWGSQGNPVVYAKCDEGAERTLLIYWMYDTMPITQPDLWNYPPFAAELVEQAPFPKVLVGRGATNSKGPQMAQWNAFMSIKAVHDKLPVNLIVVAEGDEERMSIGLRQFVKDHPELFADAEAMYRFGRGGAGGGGGLSGGSEGCVYIELTTSGAKWGRGPVYGDIHGGRKRAVDSPAWRHMQMLESLIDENGNIARVEGFYDDVEPLSADALAVMRRRAEGIDLEVAARNLGVARFISDDPFEYLKMAAYGISFNLDGVWGGNMYGGGAGAILPSKITSKHNTRYLPAQDGIDLMNKVRAQIDRNGYEDVELQVIGDVPWSKMRYDTDVAEALSRTYDIFGMPYSEPVAEETILGPYWPAYLFARDPLQMPIVGGAAGYGAGSHANNEFFVIEGAGRVYGYAGAEKSVATVLYNFGGQN